MKTLMAEVMLRLPGQAALWLHLGVFRQLAINMVRGDRSLEAVVMIDNSVTLELAMQVYPW